MSKKLLFYTGHMFCIAFPMLIYLLYDSSGEFSGPMSLLKIIWLPFCLALLLRTWCFWLAIRVVQNRLQNLLACSAGQSFFKGLGLGSIDLLIVFITGLPFYWAFKFLPFTENSTVLQFIVFAVFTIVSLACTMKVFLIIDRKLAKAV